MITKKEARKESDVIGNGGPSVMRPGSSKGWTAAEQLLTLSVANNNPPPAPGWFTIEIEGTDPENNIVPPGGNVGYRIPAIEGGHVIFRSVDVTNTGDVDLTVIWTYQYG
jgi:hypothetical protein